MIHLMPQALEIRLATPADAPQIAAMSRDLIETGLGWAWTPARVRRSICRHDCVCIVAHLGERMMGFAIMQFGDEEANLNLLAVKHDCQRAGVGRRLVQWLEESARVAGISVIRVQVRALRRGAQAFYHKLGYRPYKRIPRYYSGRETAVCMAHDLWCSPADSAAPRAQPGTG
jgi:ribosomal-protein-alanine N-acetyltransferase